MKRLSFIPFIVAVAALVVAIVCGNSVKAQRAQLVTKQAQLQRTYMPLLGIEKYIADLRWIWLIQQMGRQSGELDAKGAAYFADVIDRLTDLDPDLEQAYLLATMHIAHAAPVQAVELLQKANRYGSTSSWRWPFLAGHISERYLNRAGVKEDESLQMAENFFWESASLSGCPSYVERAWLRLKTRGAGDDPVQQLLAQKLEVAKLAQAYSGAAFNGAAFNGAEGDESMMPMDRSMMMEVSMPQRLAATLMDRAHGQIGRLLNEKSQAADDAKATLAAQLTQLRGIYDEMRELGISSGEHVCKNCLTGYGAGEFFCRSCGHGVKAFGYCPTCWKVGRLVLTSGNFCHISGDAVRVPAVMAVQK